MKYYRDSLVSLSKMSASPVPKKKRFIIKKAETVHAPEPLLKIPITPIHSEPPRPMPPQTANSYAELLEIPAVMPEELDVREAVQEWYAARGQKTPAADLIACKQIGTAAIAALKAQMAEVSKPIVVKPEYGTPEFWKQYWAKKKAAAAAAGGATPSKAS